jgi:hypothetical protein
MEDRWKMIRVTEICAAGTEANARLSARVQHLGAGQGESEAWLCYPPEYKDHLSRSADPWIAMFLWPALKLGQNLHIDAPASPALLASTRMLMDIMHCWSAGSRPIEVTSRGVSDDPAGATAVAAFFSGGVDSFYTAVKHTSPQTRPGSRLTHLISVQGLDVRLDDDTLWAQVRRHLRESATEMGGSWVECSTNVRDIVPNACIPWEMYYGSALAAIALGLTGLWRTVMIPAAQSYADLYPGGSHPLMDPLWSTESVRLVNDGAEATRIEKVARIAQCDAALEHLRVCWENRQGRYNCCRCEKCIRTMVNLQLAGVLGRCRTFNRPLNYRDVARITFTSPAQRSLMLQNYQAARESGSDPQLVRALRQCVAPSLLVRTLSPLFRQGKRIIREADQLVLGGRTRQWFHRRDQRRRKPGSASVPG